MVALPEVQEARQAAVTKQGLSTEAGGNQGRGTQCAACSARRGGRKGDPAIYGLGGNAQAPGSFLRCQSLRARP